MTTLTKPNLATASEWRIYSVESLQDVERAQSEFSNTVKPRDKPSKYLTNDVKSLCCFKYTMSKNQLARFQRNKIKSSLQTARSKITKSDLKILEKDYLNFESSIKVAYCLLLWYCQI